MKNIEYRESLTTHEFINEYIKENRPVVVKLDSFEKENWSPDTLNKIAGDLEGQIYDTLFSLEEVGQLKYYIAKNFGHSDYRENVKYMRWYNQLKDVDHAWGDEAFDRIKHLWKKPACIPSKGMLVPPSKTGELNPVIDAFPYRGILVAAKGARTRLHRDPFCSDAVVAQFYGKKDVVMYSPDRAEELRDRTPDSTSFGGFVDVRPSPLRPCIVEPDYIGVVTPGTMVYVPHGWLHDVLVVEDSISITWNFIHEMGALEYIDYLMDDPCEDTEIDVLKYFYSRAGEHYNSPGEIIKKYSSKFYEIESIFAETT